MARFLVALQPRHACRVPVHDGQNPAVASARLWCQPAGLGRVSSHLALHRRGRAHSPGLRRSVRRFVDRLCRADAACRVIPALGFAVAPHAGATAARWRAHERSAAAGQPHAEVSYRQAPVACGLGARRRSSAARAARRAPVVACGHREPHRRRKGPNAAGLECARRFGRSAPNRRTNRSRGGPGGVGSGL